MASKDEGEWVDVPADDGDWVDENQAQGKEAEFWKGVDQDYEDRKPSKMRSVGDGLMQGGLKDWGDEAVARISSLAGHGDYKDLVARQRQDMYRSKNTNPKSFGIAEFAGMLGTAPVARTPLGAAGIAGAEGVARTFGAAEKVSPKTFGDAAITGPLDAATAGMLTKYGPKAFEAMKGYMKPLADKASDKAGQLAVRALGPNLGQTKVLNKRGNTEKLGNYALDNDVVNWFRTNKGMAKQSQKVLDDIGRESKPIYDAAKGNTVSSDELLSQIGTRQSELMGEAGQVPVAEKFGKYADQVTKGADAGRTTYNPSEVARFRQQVSKGLKPGSKENNQLAADEMRRILREKEMSLIGANDPSKRVQNEDLFRRKHMSMLLEPIAERGEARTGTNNFLGLRSTGAGALATTAGTMMTGDPMTGMVAGATVGLGSEILRRYSDQWGAMTARKVANIASGKTFGPLFEAALAKGGSAVPYLHEKLLKDDPEYRKEFERSP